MYDNDNAQYHMVCKDNPILHELFSPLDWQYSHAVTTPFLSSPSFAIVCAPRFNTFWIRACRSVFNSYSIFHKHLNINHIISPLPSQAFRRTPSVMSPCKEKSMMSEEAVMVLHDIYKHLLRLLPRAKNYAGMFLDKFF